jgi:hypothetical protein
LPTIGSCHDGALHWRVTDGRQFRTTDGGATWKPVPK